MNVIVIVDILYSMHELWSVVWPPARRRTHLDHRRCAGHQDASSARKAGAAKQLTRTRLMGCKCFINGRINPAANFNLNQIKSTYRMMHVKCCVGPLATKEYLEHTLYHKAGKIRRLARRNVCVHVFCIKQIPEHKRLCRFKVETCERRICAWFYKLRHNCIRARKSILNIFTTFHITDYITQFTDRSSHQQNVATDVTCCKKNRLTNAVKLYSITQWLLITHA